MLDVRCISKMASHNDNSPVDTASDCGTEMILHSMKSDSRVFSGEEK